MVEKSKRGGATFVGAKRYAKTNNKHLGDAYDIKQESSYIACVDANNLYGWAMVQPPPYKDIEFEEINPPTLETSLTLGTVNPATLQTISEETCPESCRTSSSATLRTILETPDDVETGFCFCEVDL